MLAALVALSLASTAEAAKINPVESVVNLLEKLQKQTREEGKAEADAYDDFACFCKEQADEKLYSITKKNEHNALLSAEIDELTAAITKLNQDLTKSNKEIEALKDTNAKEKKENDERFKDYVVIRDDLAAAISQCKE